MDKGDCPREINLREGLALSVTLCLSDAPTPYSPVPAPISELATGRAPPSDPWGPPGHPNKAHTTSLQNQEPSTRLFLLLLLRSAPSLPD